jgi:hypothetical protein
MIMENIKSAIASASEAKPLDFKTHIETELKSRVYDALLAKKQEMAGHFFKDQNDADAEDDASTHIEEPADENV